MVGRKVVVVEGRLVVGRAVRGEVGAGVGEEVATVCLWVVCGEG